MIDLLNQYFVPIYLRNQDFSDEGDASSRDRSKKISIYQAALKAGLPAGTVCIYLLDPKLQPLDTAPLNQPDATNPHRLKEKLVRVVEALNVTKGKALALPKSQATPKSSENDSVQLHLTARYLQRAGDELLPLDTQSILGSQKGGNWGDLPSEAWIELSRAEWQRLLPAGEIQAGVAWELDRPVSAKLLTHFFPPTENTDLTTNRLQDQLIKARTDSVKDGIALAVLEGRLRMKHSFYHHDDNNYVDASLKGYFEFDVSTRRLRSFRLVTDRAKYGGQEFGVALQLVPQLK